MRAKPAKPPITLPTIVPVWLFFGVTAVVWIAVLVPVCVGTLPAVGRVEDKLVGLDDVLNVVLLLDDVVVVEED